MILSHEVWRLCENCVVEVWGSMDKTFLSIILAIVSISSCVITFLNHFNKPELFKKTKAEYRKKYSGRAIADFLAFFIVYTAKLISAFITITSATGFVLILVFMPTKESTITIEAEAAHTPLSTPTVTVGNDPSRTYLNEVRPLNIDPDEAFVFNGWKALYPIKVNDIEFDHSIGVRIPTDVSEDYKDNYNTERRDYDASIEYSLSYKYEKFRFKYGIDDSSFLDAGLCPPQCYFWIVVESCSSEADSEEEPKILYQTERMNYRRPLRTSDEIDVSDVETLRLTVYWEFDVMQSKPLAFNIAIINPTLYTAES